MKDEVNRRPVSEKPFVLIAIRGCQPVNSFGFTARLPAPASDSKTKKKRNISSSYVIITIIITGLAVQPYDGTVDAVGRVISENIV